ncbi:MAG: CHRD domain-containing protein [Thermosynechococcaceae cyanobacterium MS004]|nr:CHRD domain-containing protein [Thermosynechococcaceae cyanobacterium MS004]
MAIQLQTAQARTTAVDVLTAAPVLSTSLNLDSVQVQAANAGLAQGDLLSQTLIGQTLMGQTLMGQNAALQGFTAILSGKNIAPNPVQTDATGVVGASLNGSRLVVRGVFRNLSSPLRDYATDPLNPPNPNITSGVHLHRGEPTANGPFQYALQVQADPNGLNGSLSGQYTLTAEQLEALNKGQLYVDLHTRGFRTGELRGILKP